MLLDETETCYGKFELDLDFGLRQGLAGQSATHSPGHSGRLLTTRDEVAGGIVTRGFQRGGLDGGKDEKVSES